MSTAVEQHPLQKQIDQVVVDVRTGETDLSTVQWRLSQALMSAEIELQALAILDQGAMIPAPVSTNEQLQALIKQQIKLAEQGRSKSAELYQDESKDRATRIDALYNLKYYIGEKRALETLLDEIEIRNLSIVAMGVQQ